MYVHIITTTELYRLLLEHLGQDAENYLNTMDWYEMDASQNITIEGKIFKVKGSGNNSVNGEDVYMVRRFRTKKNPTIWLKPYTFPWHFYMTQNG